MDQPFSDCTESDMVDHIFGSASEFARQVELNGNNFTHEGVLVEYNEDEDIHYFFYADEAPVCLIDNDGQLAFMAPNIPSPWIRKNTSKTFWKTSQSIARETSTRHSEFSQKDFQTAGVTSNFS